MTSRLFVVQSKKGRVSGCFFCFCFPIKFWNVKTASSPLRLVDIVLVPDFLDPDLHALLAETDVLLLHLLGRLLRYVGGDCVYHVADEGGGDEHDEKDEEGNDV